MVLRVISSCLFLGLLVSSCTKKVDGVPINGELIPYYESFKEEAALRGIVFDNAVAQIEGYLQNIPDSGVLGACKRNAGNEENPQIFLDKQYWRTATNLEREYVMFHELGHCFLMLGHDDSRDGKGDCVSMMASGIGACQTNYNQFNRDSLITELFTK
ncbi:MAG: hypothetical protein ACI86M_003311 [Saprospiraceae bacterium]|jgi:hypothetical protein